MSIVAAYAVPHPPLIIPAVGCGKEKGIQDTVDAFRQVTREIVALKPELIVITSPHAPCFSNAFHVTTDARLFGDMSRFRVPYEMLQAEGNVSFTRGLIKRMQDADILAVGSEAYRDTMDHATFVALYFVRKAYLEAGGQGELPCPVVRIGMSGFSYETHRQAGKLIAEAIEESGKRTVFIASGDLSHKLLAEGPYGFAPQGPVFDARIGEIFSSGDLEGLFEFDPDFADAAAECGLRSFQMMAGAIEGLGLKSELLSLEGPYGVGYGVAAFRGQDAQAISEESPEKEAAVMQTSGDVDPYVALARLTVETWVNEHRAVDVPADVPEELLNQRAGAFVSLHSHGDLRGCIGTISATCPNVAVEIIQNGISACSRDFRFKPVRPDELDFLEYSVDILGDAEPITGPGQLDPKRYGVIVTKGRSRGLLLPNLDGVDTVEVQLAIAKQKAGIPIGDMNVGLQRFEVVRHTRGGEPRIGD